MEKPTVKLSKRAQQALELIYNRGECTANDLIEALPDIPSYSAARSILRNLEKKGHVRHETRNMQYVYLPMVSKGDAGKNALHHLIQTFFNGSPVQVMKSLLEIKESGLTQAQREDLECMIHKAEREGR